MRINIVNGKIVTGDGRTVIERGSVLIKDACISEVRDVPYTPYDDANVLIDARGGTIIPGVINNHAHEVCFGPTYHSWSATGPSFFGERRQPRERIMSYLDRHLVQGETTVLSLDGFASIWDIEAINKIHPINVKAATLHTPASLRSILLQGGEGIDAEHQAITVEEMVSLGAVAIGEACVPGSPYGLFEFWKKAGRPITASHARTLATVLFQGVDCNVLLPFDTRKMKEVLKEVGLDDVLTPDDAREVAAGIVRQHEASRESIRESVAYSKRLNVPVIAHHSPENTLDVEDLAKDLGPNLIASHSNHMFTVGEAIERAKVLKGYGSIIDIYSGDAFGSRQLSETPEVTFALMEKGLVDLISTDFIGGLWDPILFVLEKAIEEGVIGLAQAVTLATGKVSKAIPKLAPNRGLIAPWKVADIVVTKEGSLSGIDTVIIGGRIVAREGKAVY